MARVDIANSSEPVTYSVHLLRHIDDVKTKIQEKDIITTAGFFCQDDPLPNEFELTVAFGDQQENSLSVYFKPTRRDVMVKNTQVTITDGEGNRLVSTMSNQAFPCDKSNGNGWSDLIPFLCANHISRIVILCNLEYFSSATPLKLNRGRLQKDFINMFESADFADVKFLVQGEKILAHKSVLASRSVYFKNMFQADMQESSSNQVEVKDVSSTTFKAVLRFLYGENPKEEQFEPLAELVVAADKYGLDELKEICASFMGANLETENVIDALLIADMHNCPSLLQDAKILFRARTEAVKEDREKWNKLAERPSLLLELI